MQPHLMTPRVKNTLLSSIFLSLWASPAYAYLDPSSGSALISALVATATGFLYAFKSLFYRLFGKNADKLQGGAVSEIVIFNEGKIYWSTFRLIVEELIRQKVHFKYLTLDLHDPALELESPYMHAKLLPRSQSGFNFIERTKAPVMLSTTPNIGATGFST